MNKTLTLQDYELISAYLDSACSPHEIALIEARLIKDPQFKQAMLELKHTKKLLSSTPKKRAPRNFTISPAQVPQTPQRFFLAPVLSFMAMTATVLLVVVFAGSQFLRQAASRNAAESAAPMMVAEGTTAANADATENPMITWGQPSGTGTDSGPFGGGMGGGPSTITTMNNSTPEPGVIVTEGQMGITVAEPTTEATDLILGLAAEGDRGKEIVVEKTAPEPSPASISWTLVAEIGLATLAVISAVMSWVLRRRH